MGICEYIPCLRSSSCSYALDHKKPAVRKLAIVLASSTDLKESAMSPTIQTDLEAFDKATLNICLAKSMLTVIHANFGDSAHHPNIDIANTIFAASQFLEESYELLCRPSH